MPFQSAAGTSSGMGRKGFLPRPAVCFDIAPDGFVVGLYEFGSVIIHSRKLAPLDLVVQHQFDPADHALVYRRDQGLRISGGLGAPCAPDAMHIVFRLHRHVVIDDV